MGVWLGVVARAYHALLKADSLARVHDFKRRLARRGLNVSVVLDSFQSLASDHGHGRGIPNGTVWDAPSQLDNFRLYLPPELKGCVASTKGLRDEVSVFRIDIVESHDSHRCVI